LKSEKEILHFFFKEFEVFFFPHMAAFFIIIIVSTLMEICRTFLLPPTLEMPL